METNFNSRACIKELCKYSCVGPEINENEIIENNSDSLE